MIAFTWICVFHVLVAFGLWYAVGKSRISEPFRELWADWHFHTQGGKVVCNGCTQEFSALNTHSARGYICPGCKGECAPVPMPDPFVLQMIECPACLGFWIGVAFGLLYAPQHLGLGALAAVALAPLWGFATLATNLIIAKITGLME